MTRRIGEKKYRTPKTRKRVGGDIKRQPLKEETKKIVLGTKQAKFIVKSDKKNFSDLSIVDGKPQIDPDDVSSYSDELLEIIRKEMQRCINNLPGVMACPAPSADEIANKNWMENVEKERAFYQDVMQKVNIEIKKRKNA